jgi:hypothetical protein
MEERSPNLFRKHSYDIQGTLDLTESIVGKLDELAGEDRRGALLDYTVVLIEIPTNPGNYYFSFADSVVFFCLLFILLFLKSVAHEIDMKVPHLPVLIAKCQEYMRVTGKKLILLIDTTFSPSSQVLLFLFLFLF